MEAVAVTLKAGTGYTEYPTACSCIGDSMRPVRALQKLHNAPAHIWQIGLPFKC